MKLIIEVVATTLIAMGLYWLLADFFELRSDFSGALAVFCSMLTSMGLFGPGSRGKGVHLLMSIAGATLTFGVLHWFDR